MGGPRSADGGEELASFRPARTMPARALDKYAAIAREAAARRSNAVLALRARHRSSAPPARGRVWNRARRTPEVISRAGIARTFQNIRLFQNMTVLENVLTGMDRQLSGGVIGMALAIAAASRGRRPQAAEQAGELLRFVGLDGQADDAGQELALWRSAAAGDRPGPGHRAAADSARRAGRRHEPGRIAGAEST